MKNCWWEFHSENGNITSMYHQNVYKSDQPTNIFWWSDAKMSKHDVNTI